MITQADDSNTLNFPVGSAESLKLDFTSSNPSCPIVTYELLNSTNDQVQLDGDYVTYPTTQFGEEIRFRVKATALGGASLVSEEYLIMIGPEAPLQPLQHRKLSSCNPVTKSYSRSYKFPQMTREPAPVLIGKYKYMHLNFRLTSMQGSDFKIYSGSVTACNNYCNELDECVYFARHKVSTVYRCDFFKQGSGLISNTWWYLYKASKFYRYRAIQLPFGQKGDCPTDFIEPGYLSTSMRDSYRATFDACTLRTTERLPVYRHQYCRHRTSSYIMASYSNVFDLRQCAARCNRRTMCLEFSFLNHKYLRYRRCYLYKRPCGSFSNHSSYRHYSMRLPTRKSTTTKPAPVLYRHRAYCNWSHRIYYNSRFSLAQCND